VPETIFDRIAKGINFNYIIYIIALYLPGYTGERELGYLLPLLLYLHILNLRAQIPSSPQAVGPLSPVAFPNGSAVGAAITAIST
jgi:hypothetical protein